VAWVDGGGVAAARKKSGEHGQREPEGEVLGRRRRCYPSCEVFVASLHQRMRDDQRGCPLPSPLQGEGQTPTKSASPVSSSRPETHVEFAHCNGPHMDKHITGLICNNFFVMMVCNLPLWEYFGDSPGTRGHKRPCLGTIDTRVPINTPVQCP
jgi:hypothetical protein